MSGLSGRLIGTLLAFRLGALGTVLALSSGVLLAESTAENSATACPRKDLTDSVKVGRFVFRSYRNLDNGNACLVVIRDGKAIFRRALVGGQYTLGQPADAEIKVPEIANGTDLTGRGHPDMIVSAYTGGAHCCMSHYVFELEPDFKLLATLNDEDDDFAHFELLDGHYYYMTADWTFAYWPGCFACSPSAAVTLQFVVDGKGGGFHLAMERMQRAGPAPEEWRNQLDEVQKVVQGEEIPEDIGVKLWGPVLNLMYSGHSDLAWKFVEEAGPKAQQGYFPTLADFCSLLKASPYWSDLEPTLRNTPPACANAKRRRR